MTGTVVAGVPVDDAQIAAFLHDLGNAARPRDVFLETIEKHNLSLNAGKVIANRAGYPDPRRLLRAADEAAVRARVGAGSHDDPTPVVDRPHALAPDVEAEQVAGERLLEIPLSRIKPDPKNIREDLTEISELAASITQIGLLQPIVLRPSDVAGDTQLILVIGHRRRAAFELLGRETIPSVVRGAMLPDEVLAAMLMENGQRVGLNPIEEARGIAQLRAETGVTEHHKLAAKIGRNQTYVSGRLALLSLSDADQAAVRNGTMSLQRAIAKARGINGSHRPGAQGKASAAHLDFTHRLAASVENLCTVQLKHSKHKPGRIGDVGCGECWEAVIRSDERLQVQRGRQADKAELEHLEQLRDDLRQMVTGSEDFNSVDDVFAKLTHVLEGTPA